MVCAIFLVLSLVKSSTSNKGHYKQYFPDWSPNSWPSLVDECLLLNRHMELQKEVHLKCSFCFEQHGPFQTAGYLYTQVERKRAKEKQFQWSLLWFMNVPEGVKEELKLYVKTKRLGKHSSPICFKGPGCLVGEAGDQESVSLLLRSLLHPLLADEPLRGVSYSPISSFLICKTAVRMKWDNECSVYSTVLGTRYKWMRWKLWLPSDTTEHWQTDLYFESRFDSLIT